ncbi:chromosome condensation complex Condensin, subunit G [Vanrija albida]|uniref:Chromosome condensation complex Condensin, subunit G n=1 Tax=Vanrija albida TaxID=181172 RepID=A0ABR3Q6J1_9TREE
MAPTRPSVDYLTETLPTVVPPIFDQAQGTTANHRKNIVQLRKIQEKCAEITEKTPKGERLVGERAFSSLFIDMVNRILPVKKGVGVADRIVKFVAGYVTYITEQDAEDDTVTSRFVAKLLKHLLAGMEAKDKNVRFRVTLLVASLINGLGEVDDDMYQLLRHCLVERSRDKEAVVRVQAAVGLAKLQSGEDEDDLEEGQEPLSQILLDLLRYDSAVEVRRAAVYNLPTTPETLPHLLARTRDVDPILRRTVFMGSLGPAHLPDARVLSIAQRESVVQNGLGDRDPTVRKAAAAMLGGWLDQADGDVLQLLTRFDVVSSNVAEDALISVFVTRPDVFDNLELDDAWWASLTPEKAFLARVFAEYCVNNNKTNRMEEVMPVVTALAFKIQDEYNKLVGLNVDEDEDKAAEQAFIVGELLRVAINLDYADEIGRRKMFQLAREMISQGSLPETLIPRCMDVLSKITDGERDLIRLIVDVVTELRVGDGDVETQEPATPSRSTIGSPSRPTRAPVNDDPEARRREALIDYRCLLICTSLLERVNSPWQDNTVFHGLLHDVIIPAVRNKEELALRDQGLICLGLCCMIDQSMATDTFVLFMQQMNAAGEDDELRGKVMKIVLDLLMVHDIGTLVAKTMSVDAVPALLSHMLQQDVPEVLAVAVEGVAKLMLAGMVTDATVLQHLVLLYFHADTADNQPLRQCLSYFLPVYCYSSSENQRRMLEVFPLVFANFAQNEDEEDATPVAQIGLMMVDWLDPHKAVERAGAVVDLNVHLDLAISIFKLLLTEEGRDTRKTLTSYLGKLNLPDSAETDAWRPKAVLALINTLKEKQPLSDATSRNSLSKFQVSLLKLYPELEGYDEETFRAEGAEREDTKELWGFIDDVEEIEEAPEARTRRGSRAPSQSRRTASMSVDPTSDSDAAPVSRVSKPRPETVAEETEDDESEDVEGLLDSD